MSLAISLHYYCCLFLTSQPAVKFWVSSHLQARMWQQEAVDVGETVLDMISHILQLFMLIMFNLHRHTQ